ncbi:MAG: thioredoxin family protein [Lachnospiraceae bacterium]|nr:thioredoxin family protein [Lachnospiraceae bacterium]
MSMYFSRKVEWTLMTTPALVVDGKVVTYGTILKKQEVVKNLKAMNSC